MSYTIIDDHWSGLKTYWTDPKQTLRWSSVFVLPDWMQAWWQVFGSGAEMMVRTARDGERVIGIAPLMVKDGRALLVGDTEVCDYLDFIITPGREEEFLHLILEDLNKNGIRHLDLMHLRPDSCVLTGLAALAGSGRCQMVRTREAVSLELDLPVTWDEYLASLCAKQRHEVRRKLRRLSEKGNIAYDFLSPGAAISEPMAVFFHLFADSRPAKAAFLTDKMKSFFGLLAEAMARTGLLRLGLLKLDDHPMAGIMCFDYDHCIYLYNSGFDRTYHSLSAGLVCKILAIKAAIAQGKKRFDFLKGAEFYKAHLGGKAVPLYRCQITIN